MAALEFSIVVQRGGEVLVEAPLGHSVVEVLAVQVADHPSQMALLDLLAEHPSAAIGGVARLPISRKDRGIGQRPGRGGSTCARSLDHVQALGYDWVSSAHGKRGRLLGGRDRIGYSWFRWGRTPSTGGRARGKR